MNYSGNMPDWHQYNPPQSGINDVTSTAQNVNSGHLPYISSINSTQLNSLSLGSEGHEKHQSESNFNPRHFQQHLSGNIPHGHNAVDSNPLASMVQMQNCISHYGPSNTRNPMDNMNGGPMDHRNTAISGLNDELSYRNNQVPLNGPISHLNGPNVMNMNAPHSSIGSRSANINSHATSRTGPLPPPSTSSSSSSSSSSFPPCKGLCCNPDPNLNYQQWEKYCSYQSNATYRENVRTSGPYQTDARRFSGGDFNFRKDSFDGKEVLPPMVPPSAPNTDHRRNFADFKYRKDRLLPRNYQQQPTGMLQGYPLQNYNYAGDYQKYPYNVKDYSKVNGMNMPNQGMVKHQEQSYMVQQQKQYNGSKQVPYQNSGMMSGGMASSTSVNPSAMPPPPAQNTYFNPQYPRNLSMENAHDCQETADIANRMQPSTVHVSPNHRYQMYQHKIAMQKFSMENHLRELMRMQGPGYQSHPKYKECILRYKEILKLQQSTNYQGQMQQSPQCVAASTVNTAVPPINLQFDQNGVLINSNYMPEAFPRPPPQVLNPQAPAHGSDKQSKPESSNIPEMVNHGIQKPDQLPSQHDSRAIALCPENLQKQDGYPIQKNLDRSQFEMQKARGENFDNPSTSTSNAIAVMQQKMSKEFADKPELDVRQFLANWDESEEEDGANSSMPNVIISDSTPVVVVGYENVDLSAKALTNLEGSRPEEIRTSIIAFESQDKSNAGVMSAQDCLTISYSENVEIAKDACKEIVKEGIVQPGSIIQCISNGPDEAPTIHIVDNLEISSLLQVASGQDAVSFFHEGTQVETSAVVTAEADKLEKSDSGKSTAKYNAVEGNASPKAAENTSQTSQREVAASAKSNLECAQDANLKKQSSFTSEESHNPDDISLPDLPTSECTPISTTLNTPIHSDSEESPERVEDLTISTNPIEVVQNSPIISFTQSPMRNEPYDHLSDNAKNKSADSLESQYKMENRYKGDGSDNMLGHNATFKFSTNTDKNESMIPVKNKEHASPSGNGTATDSEKAYSSLVDGTQSTRTATGIRMTLTSGEYELKIASNSMQNKSIRKYTNATNKSQVVTGAPAAYKQLQTLSETGAKSNNSTQLDVQVSYPDATSAGKLSPNDDTAPRNSESTMKDGHLSRFVKNNPSTSRAKHSTLSNNKARKNETSDRSGKENFASEKNASDDDQSPNVAREKNSERINRLADSRKLVSSDRNNSHNKKYLSESGPAEKCDETTVHHDKHIREAVIHEAKSCAVEDLKESDTKQNKSNVIDNDVNGSKERMRLLKEYRRIKYKSSGAGETRNENKNAQEASDCKVSKKCHLSSNADKQLSQRDARLKSPEEQERKHAVTKTLVNKNTNPDFAIKVTNVNLKLKDNDRQRESQDSTEKATNGGALDAIKIEINVSCTERNTTEKLLHENIKNAVAETIGHLTSSISSGARSTNLTEIQRDEKVACDDEYSRECARDDRSPSAETETSSYNEVRRYQSNIEMAKHKSTVPVCKEGNITGDESFGSLMWKKKRKSSSEKESIKNVYKENDNNLEAEFTIPTVSAGTSKLEYASIRRRSVHQDADRKSIVCNSVSIEESKISLDNLSSVESTSKNIMQKKENTRNLDDNIVSRLNMGPSTSSSTADVDLASSAHADYNHFDVAPNESVIADDRRIDKLRRPKKNDGRFDNFDLHETTGGYVNPTFFSENELEDLNTVPIYTTKDGKVTYSPNPRFTYRELIMEARAKESYGNTPQPIFPRSPPFDYYSFSAKLRKVYKRHRDILGAVRKREIDSTDTNAPQYTPKRVDYLPNKNAAHKNVNCTKARTPPLEFFNDDADKLYAGRSSQQECKESNRKSIVNLTFLEKQCNPDNDLTSSIKHCKTKMFANDLDYEKEGYNESSVFDTNLFLGPRAPDCDETMESVKSYSSHVYRRRNDNFKKLNFSEIFAAQKRSKPLPLLPAKPDSPDRNNDHKTNNNSNNAANEPILPRTTSSRSDDPHLIRDGESRCEQSYAIQSNERENGNDDQKDVSATDVDNKLLSMHNTSLCNEYTRKQTQSDEIESSAIACDNEGARPCTPEITDEKVHVSEENQDRTSYAKDGETPTEHVAQDDANDINVPSADHVDQFEIENASAKAVSNEGSAEVANTPIANIDSTSLHDDPKCNIETIEKSPTFALDERTNELDDATKNILNFSVGNETMYEQVLPDLGEHGDKEEEVMLTTESSVSTKIYFTEISARSGGTCDEDNSTGYKEKESILVSQNPCNIASISRPLDEESNERKLQKLEDERPLAKDSLKNQGNDEVDDCGRAITSPPTAILNLHSVSPEQNVCDIFASQKHEQNISEFTVIKSIIKADKKQHQEPRMEAREDPKDCDSIIDSKLLCMDSSDCGIIYAEDRCALTQMSEHGFTEEDSMVPMEWETSQIQEDAVNRLCRIDESSIDFASAANSLQDNLLLDNLSLSRSAIEEPRALKVISEIVSQRASVVESVSVIEESKVISCNDDESKEQRQAASDDYDKLTYLHATDCNANTKMVPKLVIKKTETCSKFVTRLNSPSVTDDIANSKCIFGPTCQPKIPKMIIRNARSRPNTPSIEAVPEEVSMNVSDRTSLLITHNITREELYENDSESSLQGLGSHRSKIPKMKIKLDEKHSNKIVARSEDTAELHIKRKDIKKITPKVKIKNSPRTDLSDDSACSTIIFQESKDLGWYEEKVPVLKLRKQERNGSPFPEVIRKRPSSRNLETSTKKCKKFRRDEAEYSTRHGKFDSTETTALEHETKNSLARFSEKIPKVIIKRTSDSTEFKCELSKDCKNSVKSAKWQPEVKLERYRILDSMVKDSKSSCSTSVSLEVIDKIFGNRKDDCREKNDLHKISRSNSTSDLLPAKFKERRMSDYDCRRISDVSRDDFGRSHAADSKESIEICASKKNISPRNRSKSNDKCQKDDKRRSKYRDDNLRTEVDSVIISPGKGIDRSIVGRSSLKNVTSEHDKCKTDSDLDVDHEQTVKIDEITSVKLEQKNIPTSSDTSLRELKTMSKLDTCFVKLSSLSVISSEEVEPRTDKERDKWRENESFSSVADKNKVAVKSCGDMDDDTESLKDEAILDNIKRSKSVINVESSDESQTTIEILPASPNDSSRSELENNITEDGDSEQLYPADAIPTQFELELEITDNSNIDLLDIPMPKLESAVPCNSRRVSTEGYGSDQLSKVERNDKFESVHPRVKNLLEKDKHAGIDISGDDKSALGDKSVVSVEKIPSKSSCSKAIDSTAIKRNFCCNDSLIKEVLAAKETLKKCFSKSRFESNAGPKTKQGFHRNRLSKTKSDDTSQGCRDDVALLPTSSTSAANKHNKTESVPSTEKSDKKHSKQIKNIKKSILAEKKNEKESCSAPTLISSKRTKDAHKCTTISLKAIKRFDQKATSNDASLTRTVNSSKKRKSLTAQSDVDVRERDSQSRKVQNSIPSSYKIPKISRSTNQGEDAGNKKIKSKEDSMPILQPEVVASFDASSDRDSSRSPPVITNQDSGDVNMAMKLANDEIITQDNKDVEGDSGNVHKKSEMSITDFVAQLAYHEKATIQHRRYCNLCERWFPTTSRHRRHLNGYQHRHTELMQRRSIHALFTLFTGKPCPRLLPVNTLRSDCSLGELTPLQIAVQDVTKPSANTQRTPEKQKDVDK